MVAPPRPLGALRVLVVGLVVGTGCASVLGVDKSYVLVDGGGGAIEAGSVDEDGAASAGTIRCGAAGGCRAGGEECCFTGAATLACASTAVSDPCPQGTDIRCDDPSDCPGQICCIELDDGDDLLATQCQDACPATGGWTELCAASSAGTACAHGTCAALTVLPDPPFTASWFYGCR